MDRKLKSTLLNYYHSDMKSIAPYSVGGRMVDISSKLTATKTMFYALVLLTRFSSRLAYAQSPQFLTPMKCSSSLTKLPCQSYLSFINNGSQSLSDISRNFNVISSNILFPQQRYYNDLAIYLIAKNCTCNGDPTPLFFANVSYNPTPADTNLAVASIANYYYGGLVYSPIPSDVKANVPIVFQLLCGCQISNWPTIVTYIVQHGDDLEQLSIRFKSDVNVIQSLNGLPSPNVIITGQNLFIPSDFIPSEVASQDLADETSPSSPQPGKRSNGLVAGIIAAVVVLLVLVSIAACLYWRRLKNHGVYTRSVVEHSDASLAASSKPGKSGVLGAISNWFNSRRAKRSSLNNNVKRSITLPKEAMDVFDQEKPIVFAYEEIIQGTDNFNESRKLGQGSYGAVYSGTLRQQNVAIKQMMTTRWREFYAELTVLCKVHHTNLVELIGYSAGDDSLFLIYEFAENGALSQHLHRTRGNPEDTLLLSWTARVQIALDTARGLEYLHDHTKARYVHRDVKTSNILLDGLSRAKVADFGLAKLVEQNSETFVSSNRVVGTLGYMPPEYVQGGHATSKCDVYAFGVVLFELITGREAMSRTSSGRRSLISSMLHVLKEEHNPKLRFQNIVDPRLGDSFPLEWSFKMAKLARACVDEEPDKRPNMRTVVFSLSQFLLNSIEWEAALAGSSQIFSGLTQGR